MPDPLAQPRQKFFVALAGVAPNDAAQGGVRFERRGVKPDRLTIDQAGASKALCHPGEHRPMRFDRDEAPRAGNRRVVRRCVMQIETEEMAQMPTSPPLAT